MRRMNERSSKFTLLCNNANRGRWLTNNNANCRAASPYVCEIVLAFMSLALNIVLEAALIV